jgi:N-acetylmuramoyl-L-alanine amidase-like protein
VSVARAREVAARLRAAGVTVYEWPGWESRGNGLTSAYEGLVVHHTASGYGSAFPVLVDGRPDLSGPLCNTSGNADGSVTLIAAHPANHAGAGFGRSMGPLPRTSLFNNRVWGHETVYPGDQPMTDAQYRTAAILARICTDVFGYGDIERARAHAETSGEGKWDPGYAPGLTIDMGAFRSDALNIQEDDLSAAAEEMISQIYASMSKMSAQRGIDVGDAFVSMFDSLKPVAVETGLKGSDGKTPTLTIRPNDAAANVYAMTFFGSNYGFGEAIVKQLAELSGGTVDVDEEALARHINGSLAPAVAQAVVEVALPAIREVMGEDNQEQAQAVVDLIRQKLGGAA